MVSEVYFFTEMGYSRYAFLAIALRQDLVAVLAGPEAAWAFVGGVVRRLVVDNHPRGHPA